MPESHVVFEKLLSSSCSRAASLWSHHNGSLSSYPIWVIVVETCVTMQPLSLSLICCHGVVFVKPFPWSHVSMKPLQLQLLSSCCLELLHLSCYHWDQCCHEAIAIEPIEPLLFSSGHCQVMLLWSHCHPAPAIAPSCRCCIHVILKMGGSFCVCVLPGVGDMAEYVGLTCPRLGSFLPFSWRPKI